MGNKQNKPVTQYPNAETSSDHWKNIVVGENEYLFLVPDQFQRPDYDEHTSKSSDTGLVFIPQEVLEMDPHSIKTYVNALEHGTEKCRNFRVQLIGYSGAGKSCLARKLMGKMYKNIPSTHGIDVHKITVQDANWETRSESNARNDFIEDRLTNVLNTETVRNLSSSLDNKQTKNSNQDEETILENKAVRSNICTPPTDSEEKKLNKNANAGEKIIRHSKTNVCARDIPDQSKEKSTTKKLIKFFEQIAAGALSSNSVTKQQSFCLAVDTDKDKKRRLPKPPLLPKPNLPGKTLQKKENEIKISVREKQDLQRILSRSKEIVNDLQEVYLSLWDFAGQFVYYATHHIFQTSNAVYLLVFDLSKSLSEFIEDEEFPLDQLFPDGQSAHQGRTVKDFAEMWVFTLLHYASDTPKTPPLFLVGTHKDRISGSGSIKENHADGFFEQVRKLFDETPASHLIQAQDFLVDNTNDREDIDALRDAIVQAAQKLPIWNKVLPARYILLERALQEASESGRKIVTLQHVVDIDKENSVKLGEVNDIKVFLLFQHSQGNVVYLDEDNLQNTVVLDPIWLIDAFKSLISAKQFCRIRSDLRGLWKELQDNAILKKELAFCVWKDLGTQFYENRESILTLMDRLNLIAVLRHCDQSDTEDVNQSFLVPSLLRSNASKEIIDTVKSVRNKTPTLCFVFQEGYIPVTLFPRLLAACLSKWVLFQFGSKRCRIFKDVAIFQLDADDSVLSSHLFCLASQKNKIQLTVLKLCDQDISPQSSDFIRRFIDRQLEKELGKKKNEVVKVCVKCDECNNGKAVYNCQDLLKVDCVQCLFHNKNDVHIIHSKQILRFWFSDELNLSEENWFKETSADQRQRIATDKELAKLAQCIGNGWELIGTDLGVSPVEIEHIKEENKYSVAMQIYYVLQKWKRGCKTGEATFERIAKTLLDSPSVHINWDKVKNIIDGI